MFSGKVTEGGSLTAGDSVFIAIGKNHTNLTVRCVERFNRDIHYGLKVGDSVGLIFGGRDIQPAIGDVLCKGRTLGNL